MIKGAIAELPICLRCQYRLSQARIKVPWRKGRQLQVHTRGLKQWPTLLESQAAAVAKDLDHDNAPGKQEGETSSDGTHPAQLFRYVRSFQAPRRKRQARKESLGVESFGAPAEALVLEEPQRDDPKLGVLAHHAASVGGETADVFSTPDELMHEVDSGYDVADVDQACSNIDLLRQRLFQGQNQRRDLGTKEYDSLQDSLANSFQRKHLVEYLERTSPKTTTDPSDIHKPFSSEHYVRSAWTPIVSSQLSWYHTPRLGATQEEIPSHSRASSWKYMSKPALAEAIIQSRWNLRCHQPPSLNGTVSLSVRPAHLRLLLDHPRNPLRHVGEIFHTEIEAYRKTGVIRIVSNFTVAKEVLRVLTQLCESVCSTIVKLSSEEGPESEQALSNDYLLQVATLTNTVIYRNEKSRETCTVLYLGPETTDLDDAERLLKHRVESVLGHAGQSKEHLLYKPSSEPVCLVPIEHRESLPVADRSIAWGRIAHPITSLVGREVSKLPKKTVNIMRGPQAAAKRVIDFLLSKSCNHISPRQNSKHWKEGLSASTSAMLGHATFQVRDSQSYSNNLGFEAFLQNKPGADSVFIPFVPGSMRSFGTFDIAPETFEATEGTGISESLRLKMIADPDESELAQPWAAILPTLDIEMGINRQTGATTFKWAKFVVHDSVLNFMLPMRMLDIQFSLQSYLLNNEENIDPSLLDFVDVSNLNFLRSETLRTPNHLHIRIPRHALREGQDIDQSIFVDGLRMRYAFSNLEYRSSMELRTRLDKQSRNRILPFSDHHVTFTHVEAGRLGGNRDELVIHDLGDLLPADEDDLTNVSVLDAVEDQQPTVDIDRLQEVERTPDGPEWIQKARALGPRGRARRLLKAALAVAGIVEPRELGGLKT